MQGNGFFGVGTHELPSNGFPGHTPFGYMNHITGAIAWFNKQALKSQEYVLNNKINLQNKEVIFTVNADRRRCKINFDNQEIEKEYPLQNPVYIVFALGNGGEVSII